MDEKPCKSLHMGRGGPLTRTSFVYGTLSLCFAVAFYFINGFAPTFPYADPRWIGIVLLNIALVSWAGVLGLAGAIAGIIGSILYQPRWVSVVGAIESILAISIVVLRISLS